MSKYKIGDRVKILDGSNIRDYRCVWYDEGMKEFVGTMGVIDYIVEPLGKECAGYRLKGNPYTWDERGLELAELKARDGENLKPPHPRWEPEFGDIYYTTYCAEDAAKCHWMRDSLDNEYYSLGFVFKTKDEAEFDAERLKVLAKMREWAGKWNDRYTISVDPCDSTKLDAFDRSQLWPNGEMRFATEEDAKNCIKAVGEERIKKYYFMIPEETNND